MKKVMTQEDKNKLLLQDLCARLPYDVICEVYDPLQDYEEDYFNAHLIQIDAWTSYCYFWGCSETDPYKIWQVKPYLRPMSSMTEEEFKSMEEYSGLKYEQLDLASYQNGTYKCLDFYLSEVPSYVVKLVFDWLNSYHFDYCGLIEQCLAIAVTEENNPYKD